MTDSDGRASRAEALVREGRTAEAVELFFELIVDHAKAKRFRQAEALRERLIAVDEMALTPIIRSAEIIEAERQDALDTDHLERWSPLYRHLSPEEVSTLFFSLEEVRCEAGQVLMRQGRPAEGLLLPDSGRFKLFFRQGDGYRLIQIVEPGTPAGQESLTARTVATAFLAAEVPSTVRILPAATFRDWKTAAPGLRTRLSTFCEKTHQIPRLLRDSRQDRRGAGRFPSSGRVAAQILDAEGRPASKPFSGELENLCAAGLAFTIKATEKAANALFARPLGIGFSVATAQGGEPVKGRCRVVAVVDRHFGDFSVHCRLSPPLDDRLVPGPPPGQSGAAAP